VTEKWGKWRYVAYVEEIPDVSTQGQTLAEARRNLKEPSRWSLRQIANRPLEDARREPIVANLQTL